MNILITGGLGYIGSAVALKLSSIDMVGKVILYDNFLRKNFGLLTGQNLTASKMSLIQGDILDEPKLESALKDIDVVIHLAAMVANPMLDTQSHYYDQVNNYGTAQIVDLVKRHSSVKRIVYLSSASIYGSQNAPFTIKDVPNPKTFYAKSKLEGEKHIRNLESSIDTFVLRCGNVYGNSPAIRTETVINKFMFDANYFGKISVYGNGYQKRAFISIDNLAHTIQELILSSSHASGTYHVLENNYSVNEISDIVKDLYPGLNTFYINRDYEALNIELSSDNSIFYADSQNKNGIEDQLAKFKKSFSFS